MAELVERYIHQVGRYLPPKERAEIEAELRSQIQDQLDDRYGGSPKPEEVAAALAEFGHPYMVAASYSSDKYLVGPTLYPYMMMVLRYGWVLVPATVVFLNIFGALVSPQQRPLLGLLVDTVIATLQATLIFSAVVVLFFAIMQHSGAERDEKKTAFNPLELPEVDDPGVVDRAEGTFGSAFGTVMSLVLLYWLQVGGLTLRFNVSDPGEVIPVPIPWLILLIIACFAMLILQVLVLRRNRWSIASWLIETVLEVFGMVCLYFAVLGPFFQRLLTVNPSLTSWPLSDRWPQIIAVSFAVITLLGRGSRLVKLWNYRQSATPPFTVKTNG
jgi:hypothetical protein